MSSAELLKAAAKQQARERGEEVSVSSDDGEELDQTTPAPEFPEDTKTPMGKKSGDQVQPDDIPLPPLGTLKPDFIHLEDVFSDGYIPFAYTLHPELKARDVKVEMAAVVPPSLPGPTTGANTRSPQPSVDPKDILLAPGGLKVYSEARNEFAGRLAKGLKGHAFRRSEKGSRIVYEFESDMINLFINENCIGPGMIAMEPVPVLNKVGQFHHSSDGFSQLGAAVAESSRNSKEGKVPGISGDARAELRERLHITRTNYEEYVRNLHVCGCIQLLRQQDLFLHKFTTLPDYGLVIDVNRVVSHPDNPKIGVQLPHVDSDECRRIRPTTATLRERMESGLEGDHSGELPFESTPAKGKEREYIPPVVKPFLDTLPNFNVGSQSGDKDAKLSAKDVKPEPSRAGPSRETDRPPEPDASGSHQSEESHPPPRRSTKRTTSSWTPRRWASPWTTRWWWTPIQSRWWPTPWIRIPIHSIPAPFSRWRTP